MLVRSILRGSSRLHINPPALTDAVFRRQTELFEDLQADNDDSGTLLLQQQLAVPLGRIVTLILTRTAPELDADNEAEPAQVQARMVRHRAVQTTTMLLTALAQRQLPMPQAGLLLDAIMQLFRCSEEGSFYDLALLTEGLTMLVLMVPGLRDAVQTAQAVHSTIRAVVTVLRTFSSDDPGSFVQKGVMRLSLLALTRLSALLQEQPALRHDFWGPHFFFDNSCDWMVALTADIDEQVRVSALELMAHVLADPAGAVVLGAARAHVATPVPGDARSVLSSAPSHEDGDAATGEPPLNMLEYALLLADDAEAPVAVRAAALRCVESLAGLEHLPFSFFSPQLEQAALLADGADASATPLGSGLVALLQLNVPQRLQQQLVAGTSTAACPAVVRTVASTLWQLLHRHGLHPRLVQAVVQADLVGSLLRAWLQLSRVQNAAPQAETDSATEAVAKVVLLGLRLEDETAGQPPRVLMGQPVRQHGFVALATTFLMGLHDGLANRQRVSVLECVAALFTQAEAIPGVALPSPSHVTAQGVLRPLQEMLATPVNADSVTLELQLRCVSAAAGVYLGFCKCWPAVMLQYNREVADMLARVYAAVVQLRPDGGIGENGQEATANVSLVSGEGGRVLPSFVTYSAVCKVQEAMTWLLDAAQRVPQPAAATATPTTASAPSAAVVVCVLAAGVRLQQGVHAAAALLLHSWAATPTTAAHRTILALLVRTLQLQSQALQLAVDGGDLRLSPYRPQFLALARQQLEALQHLRPLAAGVASSATDLLLPWLQCVAACLPLAVETRGDEPYRPPPLPEAAVDVTQAVLNLLLSGRECGSDVTAAALAACQAAVRGGGSLLALVLHGPLLDQLPRRWLRGVEPVSVLVAALGLLASMTQSAEGLQSVLQRPPLVDQVVGMVEAGGGTTTGAVVDSSGTAATRRLALIILHHLCHMPGVKGLAVRLYAVLQRALGAARAQGNAGDARLCERGCEVLQKLYSHELGGVR